MQHCLRGSSCWNTLENHYLVCVGFPALKSCCSVRTGLNLQKHKWLLFNLAKLWFQCDSPPPPIPMFWLIDEAHLCTSLAWLVQIIFWLENTPHHTHISPQAHTSCVERREGVPVVCVWAGPCDSLCSACGQGAVRVRCVAQGHLDTNFMPV